MGEAIGHFKIITQPSARFAALSVVVAGKSSAAVDAGDAASPADAFAVADALALPVGGVTSTV
jgi:hypothetical protein